MIGPILTGVLVYALIRFVWWCVQDCLDDIRWWSERR